ncbi:MAG: hypothetical protein Q7U04_02810 [Bacteriovorax sp.]|nr:hypothetical protein [Bacteriovorax sp.]
MKKLSKNLLVSLTLALSFQSMAFAENDRHNLSNNPIGSMLGLSSLEYSYKIFDHMTIGLTGASGRIKISNTQIAGDSYGVISRIYFQPAFVNDSWYIVAAATKMKHYEVSITKNAIKYTGKLKETDISGGVGYHWFWSSFNANLGALMTNQPNLELRDVSGNKYKNYDKTVSAEFNIGWKF